MVDAGQAAIRGWLDQLLGVDGLDAQIAAKPMVVIGGKDDDLPGSDRNRLLIGDLQKHPAARDVVVGDHMRREGHHEEPDLFRPDRRCSDAPGRAELAVQEDAAREAERSQDIQQRVHLQPARRICQLIRRCGHSPGKRLDLRNLRTITATNRRAFVA
jgi:hypothetical protein